MEKEKNDKVEPDKAPKEKKPLTEEQRIKRNKMIAIPCMCLVCALVLWLIFKPSASEGEKGSKGFNMEMPDAEKTDVEADKRKAYSKEDLANKQKEKSRAMNTLGEYMPGIDSTATRQEKDFDLMQSGQQPTKAERQEADAIRSSAEAYQTLNTTLSGFYEQPQQGGSSEDAELRKRLDELEASMMQRATLFPTCCATSMTQRFPPLSTSSASLINGRSSLLSNSTSTTGPMTCTILPFVIVFYLTSFSVHWHRRSPQSAPG